MISFENTDYDSVLNRLLDDMASRYPEVDTRQSSLAYNAIVASAAEIANLYSEQDAFARETFAETATREGLVEKLHEIGLVAQDATYGEFEGEFNIPIEIGTRFNNDLYNYSVIELIKEPSGADEYYHYKLLCDTAGSAPNNTFGNLTPIDYVQDLEWAQLTNLIKAGEDEEDTEAMRIRYFYAVNNSHTDGNIAQYKYWADEFDGVGRSKIFPCWNGVGTVKVSIISSAGRAVSSSLLKEFQDYLDPDSKGLGEGQAPIGAKVTCTTATEQKVNIIANVKLADGYTDVTTIDTTKVLTDFFAEIAYVDSSVNFMKLGALLMTVDGIKSVESLTLNGSSGNLTLGDEVVPVLGTVTLKKV